MKATFLVNVIGNHLDRLTLQLNYGIYLLDCYFSLSLIRIMIMSISSNLMLLPKLSNQKERNDTVVFDTPSDTVVSDALIDTVVSETPNDIVVFDALNDPMVIDALIDTVVCDALIDIVVFDGNRQLILL